MDKLEMTFDPKTIEHLGVRMYSTLPPVLAELIANSYDANSTKVMVILKDENLEKEIIVDDNGIGMTFDDINNKFLKIGRNRRFEDENSNRRKIIGKKGLGKLSFFGIADEIEVVTKKDGKENAFLLKWEDIKNSPTVNYQPVIIYKDKICSPTDSGTKITLKKIKRESDFSGENIADSLSKIFIIESDFEIIVKHNGDKEIKIENNRRYSGLEKQIEWNVPQDINFDNDYENKDKVTGYLVATEKPISPRTNMRGITLFSRKKMVNSAEYFSDSESSHFFSYLTGSLEIDFIDDLEEDVISTDRQSVNWGHPKMVELRKYLQEMIRWLEKDWRIKRDKLRKEDLNTEMENRGLSIREWKSHVPEELNNLLDPIIESIIGKSEFSNDEISGAVKNLRSLIPPYPYYHYQNLHSSLSSEVFGYYKKEDYYNAVAQGVIKYIREIQSKSGSKLTDLDLIKDIFIPDRDPKTGIRPDPKFSVTKKYKRPSGKEFEKDTHKNIILGHGMLAYAMWSAFRNPIHHELADDLKNSGLYTEQDCLDALGLLSHLFRRLDNSEVF